MMKEIAFYAFEKWEDLIDETGGEYAISNYGRVKRKRQLPIKGQPFKNRYLDERIWEGHVMKGSGYRRVQLTDPRTGITKWYKVHRLVAKYFIDNPHDLPQVNHLDGNKTNNHVYNLAWCTSIENIQHSQNVLGRGVLKPRPIYQMDMDENIIKIWPSLNSAVRNVPGVNPKSLRNVLAGIHKSHAGYKWRDAS